MFQFHIRFQVLIIRLKNDVKKIENFLNEVQFIQLLKKLLILIFFLLQHFYEIYFF